MVSDPLKGRTELFLPVNEIFKNWCLVWEFWQIFLAEGFERAEGERDEIR